MLDESMDIFIKRIKDKVVTDDKMTEIPLAYLMSLDIPESIKHFFDQEVELWIREEEEKFTTTDRFDYDMPEVRMLIDQMFDLLKQHARFHITKFNQLLERAVKLEKNYLIEPHRTLRQFLFKDSKVISTREVYDTLKYFTHYQYYKSAISDYFNLKYLHEISEKQFEELINQIDEKAFSENPVDTTLKMFKTILSFLGDARGQTVNTLSLDVIYSALNDRNLTRYIDLFQKIRKNTDVDELTFDQIEHILKHEEYPAEKESAEETQISFESHEDLEESRPDIDIDELEVDETVPSDIIEEEDEETEEELIEEVDEEELEEEEEPETADEDEEMVETRGNVADALADHVAKQISSDIPLEDINNMIKGRKRRKIVKKLFNKDEAELLQFINNINVLETWKDASHVMDDEFYKRGINPYSKEAILLSDIIYMRFFPKDKYVSSSEERDWM
ncbi:MAG: hypothetical protein GF313_07835 [Caldithrix sp.]|nr:hypothetical protein [Caldithrix sp.]